MTSNDGEKSEFSADPDKLVEGMLADVKGIAVRIHRRLHVRVPLDVVVQAGIVGLLDAARRFDRAGNAQSGNCGLPHLHDSGRTCRTF